MVTVALHSFALSSLLLISGIIPSCFYAVRGYTAVKDSSTLLCPDQPQVVKLNSNTKYAFQMNSTSVAAMGFAMFQIHTQSANVTVSPSPGFNMAQSENGTGRGLVFPIHAHMANQSVPLTAYVWNYHNQSIYGLVSFIAYGRTVPVPGGCNEEFVFEDDANIHLNDMADGFVALMQFQYGDLRSASTSSLQRQPRDWCEDTESWKWLFYDVYVYYLPEERTEDELWYLSNVQQFMSVSDVINRGKLVQTIQRGQNSAKPRLSLMANAGWQRFLVNIVVRVNDTPTAAAAAAAYIPVASNDCDPGLSTCNGLAYWFVIAYNALVLLSGLLLCFLGHRLFKVEMFVNGFFVLLLLGYIALAKTTSLPFWGLLLVAGACGAAGGGIWLAMWQYFGRPHVSMLLPIYVLGYVVSMLLLVTPFGVLQILHNDLAYWTIFCSLILLIPLVCLFFTKHWAKLNVLLCSVVGSYCFVFSLSSYVDASVHRWALFPVLRATVDGYSDAILVYPYQLKDILLSVAWTLLAATGSLFQFRRDGWRPALPVLPASARLRLRPQRVFDRVNPDVYVEARQRLLSDDEHSGPPPAYGAVDEHRLPGRMDGVHVPPPAYSPVDGR